ncbi:MAG TPA: DUF1254 domain-containing protein [Acidimicrobiales bacterium]|nr:DUF1254 domain-containing protein [Acidimicrobiales bacterium]
MTDASAYVFEGCYPTDETIRQAFDDADLNRAVSAYRFFYPTVSIMATWKGNLDAGMVPTQVFGILEGTPQQLVFTPNSDTPYAGLVLDVRDGPMVVELPPGPLMCTANDLNQRWVIDMGLPGPDGGRGGKHVICGPGYGGDLPEGFYSGTATTNRVLLLLRALARGDDMAGAIAAMKTVKVYPLRSTDSWADPTWVNLTELRGVDFTPVRWEDNLAYWRVLHEVVDSEPPFEEFRAFYGELAALGIAKGQPFDPDERMVDILTRAAEIGRGAAAGAILRRSPPGPSGVAGHPVGVGGAATRERHLRYAHLPRRPRPPEMVLPSPDRITGHVPTHPRRRIAVLARHPRRHWHLPRRWPLLPPHRAPAGPGSAVLVDHRLRRPNP